MQKTGCNYTKVSRSDEISLAKKNISKLNDSGLKILILTKKKY